MEGPLRLPAESGGEGMTHTDKLAAILAAVQTDPGNRGLARDPVDNLFTATAGDFERACLSIVEVECPAVWIVTGFHIPDGSPPAFETDGPLGARALIRAFEWINIPVSIRCESEVAQAIGVGVGYADHEYAEADEPSHLIFLERAGPATDGRRYSMRGREIEANSDPVYDAVPLGAVTIGIGDGGNEIGMGKIPHETIVKNIPNGDLIHCRVPTDHLIVAGVSNWGAYALAAGLFVLLDRKPPADLFDPDRELAILEAMVREGPLVDGVTGKQTATVDGLSWEEYSRPLIEIQRILDS